MEELNINGKTTAITNKISDVLEYLKNRRALLLYQKGISQIASYFCSSNSIDVKMLQIDDGESAKNIETVRMLIDYLIENGFTRSDSIIALGGGSIGDTAGFTASIYKRGMGLLIIPTTLLSMVDSSIGGKNGIDYQEGKNIIGTFYQPDLVFTNIDFLDTLPFEEYLSGIGEIIKYGISIDINLLSFMVSHQDQIISKNKETLRKIVHWAQEIKLTVVKQDERETSGIREILNLGHTVGHAIESTSNFRIKHGIAVIQGINVECNLAAKFGFTEYITCEKIRKIVEKFNFPHIEHLNIDDIIRYISYDKKIKSGKINFPVIRSIGRVEVSKIDFESFMKGLKDEKIWSYW